MKLKPIAALLPGLCLLPNLSWSDENVEEMLVTATRTAQNLDATLAPVTVLNRIDLDRLQPADLPDLLMRIPGADIKRSGGEGSAASLFLRGTSSEHTLVLVDGQRMSSASNGSSPISYIDSEMIERIEVVRGPRSSLYGADAIGGVIQIFTRQTGTYLKAGYGSHNAYRLAGGHYDTQGAWRYGASVSYYQTDGIDNTVDDTPPHNDDDAYRNTSINARLGYDFSENHQLDLRYSHVRTQNEYDDLYGAGRPYSDSWLQNIDLSLKSAATSWWLNTFRIGHTIIDSDDLDDVIPTAHDTYRTTRWAASWQNDFTLAQGHIATLGFDYYDDELESSADHQAADGKRVKNRDNKAVFAQYQGGTGFMDWTIGGRYDDNEHHSSESTGNISLGFSLPRQHRLILSYGTGFRAPTFNDLYWPGSGNPDLEPETSKNSEVEVRGDYDHWQWALNLYRNEVDQLIAWAPSQPGSWVWQPFNINSATIEGVDLSVATRLDEWQVGLSASYVEARDDDTDQILKDRARASASLDLDRRFGDFSVGLSWRVQNGRYVYGNERRLPGYGTLGVRLGYQLTPNLNLALKINNATDKVYQLSEPYRQDRSNAFLTATWTL